MAKMIPPYCSSDTNSRGEREIFSRFQTDPDTKDWIVLHSLNLSNHVSQLYGEIDFLVLAPSLGIFCLEVKSGRVERENGLWKYSTMLGTQKSTTSARGPFKQAQDAMFSLHKAIQKKFGINHKFSKLLFGYGVMFPHIQYEPHGLDEEKWKIFDRNSKTQPISRYLMQLSKNKQKKVSHCSWFDKNTSLPTANDVKALADFLRGDFEKIISLAKISEDNAEEIKSFTEEQYQILDQIEDNKRFILQGAAGTGKTVLAIESLNRSVASRKKTLMLCFNKLLASHLNAQLRHLDSQFTTVDTFHRFMRRYSNIQVKDTDVKNDDFWNYELPLSIIEAVDSDRLEPYDALILDEAQDLITSTNLDVFDSLLHGGLAGGNWRFFCDFERQAIYSHTNSKEGFFDLLNKRASFAQFKLTTNCRNTRPIGEQTSLLSGFDKPPFLPSKVEGLPVVVSFYDSIDDQISQLQKTLKELIKQKVPPCKITILSPFSFEKSVASTLGRSGFNIHNLKERGTIDEKHLLFSTIQAYKGLENAYVILTDIYSLEEKMRSLLYVGMSRPYSRLYVFIDTSEKQNYQNLIRKQLGVL